MAEWAIGRRNVVASVLACLCLLTRAPSLAELGHREDLGSGWSFQFYRMRTACSLDKAGDDGSNLHFATSIHDTSIFFGMSHRKWRLLAGVERAPARIVQQQREVEVLALDVGDWRGGVRAATYVRIASEHLDVRSFLERGQFEVTVPGVGTHVVEQSDAEFALRILNHCFPNEN